ncbi:efflux RND transporter periplasmic adaptor subunit [Pelagicoccus sp. SDUM812003]|uniref:efflux RND transporter periplasmic adaptor subunit n=1 Tax=Pelagicoccus sp. SDUM812003 TaxID=3041267 RepID=UPI00280F81FA|nr:efflux RND transporter periplasmic adaptor subunit [Pelagicoccus sp. SDUM812003]MDQ8202337.1 efflux RND transporter periplasmic adaptor subunit [Pelagicoccus sp. SDUM812003]
MSSPSKRRPIAIATLVLAALLLFWWLTQSPEDDVSNDRGRIAAVAVAPIQDGPIELKRIFTGALEARNKFVVAPKVAGRVIDIPVDISDPVDRGDTVAILDAAEFEQAVRQAEADLAVANANLAEAKSTLEIAQRAYQRSSTLRERGIASDSEYDNVQAALLARQAEFKVAEAQVIRAKSELESARIRLSYTRITADWADKESQRVVAERYVDEGETVSPNDPLLLIVEINPITAVINVTERDYRLLKPGFQAAFTTDAFPNTVFEGQVERISPIFRESSRQARVELSLDNPQGQLKPGMFVRANITLDRVDDAIVVPYAAITRRGSEEGVFVVDAGGETVSWRPVETGIRAGEAIQVSGEGLQGRVVVLGQHLLDDGSEIVIPDEEGSESES